MTESKKKSIFKKSAFFAVGTAFGLSLAGGVAFADDINVSLNPLKILVNGVDKTPTDNQFNNNGAVVPAELVYNGTTYVPLRLASNLLGTPISYDGANQTIHLGADPQNATYLSDIQPYASSSNTGTISNNDQKTNTNYFVNNFQMVMAGNSYAKGIAIGTEGDGSGYNHNVYYNLNGKYNSLTSLVGFDDQSDKQTDKVVSIFADGNKVWTNEFQMGDLPKSISISLTGVNQLEIQVQDTGYNNAIVDMVNPVIK